MHLRDRINQLDPPCTSVLVGDKFSNTAAEGCKFAALPDNLENAGMFERSLRFTDSEGTQTINFIDLYKRDCFVCQIKQGVELAGVQDLLSSTGRRKRPTCWR